MTARFQPAANPSIVQTQAARAPGQVHVVVVGNEKGGSGKSTTAVHIAVALLSEGSRVATLDLDARQGTLSRYIENRAAYIKRTGVDLPTPLHATVAPSILADRASAEADEKANFEATLGRLVPAVDYVVIDTPGSDTNLSRLAHARADTLLTPLNDSHRSRPAGTRRSRYPQDRAPLDLCRSRMEAAAAARCPWRPAG